jgi:hypothetical protein
VQLLGLSSSALVQVNFSFWNMAQQGRGLSQQGVLTCTHANSSNGFTDDSFQASAFAAHVVWCTLCSDAYF